MTTELKTLVAEAEAAIEQAVDLSALDQVRVGILGKKGALTAILKT
ncbi:MAG TPA: phenylalanine--tRNA ligase subunit alpha, partial [Gammaproteobacteria bacterium]|nr:phenylalanine--tRNA ligase subunit alpha [Gammaproteobacteria bacterium]